VYFIGGVAHPDDALSIGAYAEYIAVSTKMLIHKPKQLSWEQAAGVPEVTSIDLLLKIGRSLIRDGSDLDHCLAGSLAHR
jgi:hypothetical protein